MSLEMAINKTINYALKYGCSLTKEEAEERLLGDRVYDLSDTGKRFKTKNDNKYRGRKLKLAEILVNNYLKRLPNILMVGVTGSVASGYPGEDDDIDLMIVTKASKLWWTRLLVRWLIFKDQIPHREWRDDQEKDKFCFNLWLDEKNLKIISQKQNLRSAVDLILMKPLLNREQTYEKFLKTNGWVTKYSATGYKKLAERFKIEDLKETKRIDFNLAAKFTNWILYWGQYFYMKKKITTEKVNSGWAYFHPSKKAVKIRA